MEKTSTILVTAATWYIGTQTIEAIKKQYPRTKVVAGVYCKSKRAGCPEIWARADETMVFDAEDPGSLDFTRFNVVCIFPSTSATRLIQVSNMIDECKHSPKKPFVVFCTVADPLGADGEYTNSTRHMELMLKESGVKHVIVNCGFFHQNFEWNIKEMKNEHRICLPIGTGEFAPVDARDVARFIANVLKDPGYHGGKQYHMVGQQLINGAGAARIASQSLGYSVTFEDIPLKTFSDDLKEQGCSDGMAKLLCELCEAIRNHKCETSIAGDVLVTLKDRVTKLKEYFKDFGVLYGGEGWEIPGRPIDEGYAEGKEEETMATTREFEYGDEEEEALRENESDRDQWDAHYGEGWELEADRDRSPVPYGQEQRESWEAIQVEKPVQYEEEWGAEEAEKPVQYAEEWGAEEVETPDEDGEEWGAEEAEKPVQRVEEADRDQSPVQRGREQPEIWGTTVAEKSVKQAEGWDVKKQPAQYGRKKQAQWGAKEAGQDGTSTQYGREEPAKRVAKADRRPTQYAHEEPAERMSKADQRPTQYGRKELAERVAKQDLKRTQYGREEPAEWGAKQADQGRTSTQNDRKEWVQWGPKTTEQGGRPTREEREGWKVRAADRDRRPAQYGREEQDEWGAKEADRDRKHALNRRKEMDEWKSKAADRVRSEGRQVRNTTAKREEKAHTGIASLTAEEDNIVAFEREFYSLKPKTENRVKVLVNAQRDCEELSSLLDDTIDHLNEMLKDRRGSLEADGRLVKQLANRKDDIDQIVRQLDREIRDQKRGPSTERPFVVYPTSMPPPTRLPYPADEKLESRIERDESPGREAKGQRGRARYHEERGYTENFLEQYQGAGREAEYERYRPRERTRYPEERGYPEKRRERRSASTTHLGRDLARRRSSKRRSASSTHLGRELARGRTSTQLGRELNNYKGENLLSKISQILYGWKDKGERERGQGGRRELEGGEAHRREGEMYGYEEPRRQYARREHEREYRKGENEERSRRENERQDREREERLRELERHDRRLEERHRRVFERQDHEYDERNYDQEQRKYALERPKGYKESRSELRETAKVRERNEPKYRKVETGQKRESGYGSDLEDTYVWIPKQVIQEA